MSGSPRSSNLESRGLRPEAAGALAGVFEWVEEALAARGARFALGGELYVPGRIELLGKHTDYAGGRSLVAALDRGICLVWAPRSGDLVDVLDVGWREERVFPLAPDLHPPMRDWSNYPMTVARRLARNFPEARRGARLAFASNIPPASGLSSSSALLTATFLALARANRLDENEAWRREIGSPEDLAAYLGAVENGRGFRVFEGDRGVGTSGGSEDHTAILCSSSKRFGLFGYNPIVREREVPMPDGYVLVIASSGVTAEKTGTARKPYNEISREASLVLEGWRQMSGRDDVSLAAAVRSSPEAPDRIREMIRAATFPVAAGTSVRRLADRFEHFLDESERIVPEAAQALAANRLDVFAGLAARSQEQAERLLGNQVPETIFLAAAARRMGALAASAFGGGFGGSVWAMVPARDASGFESELAARYRASFPNRADAARIFTTLPGPSAFWLE